MTIIKLKIFFITFLVVLSMILLCSCDGGLVTISLEIAGTPNRVVYIAHVDTEIDLNGLTLIAIDREGNIDEIPLEIWIKTWEERGQGIIKLLYHEIDFANPGVYEVEIYYEWRYIGATKFQSENRILSYKFFIQVIDDDNYYALKNLKKGHIP